MSRLYNTNRQSIESTNSSSPGESGGDNENERTPITPRTDPNSFIGKDELLKQLKRQLKQFEEWYEREDWLAFHHHHYDWWMFPSKFKIKTHLFYFLFILVDEISSRGSTYQLTDDVIDELRKDKEFISDVRKGVRLMVSSWGWVRFFNIHSIFII